MVVTRMILDQLIEKNYVEVIVDGTVVRRVKA